MSESSSKPRLSPNDQKTRRYRFGPGLLVTAAFIGPGTVSTASKAGAAFGFTLLWAVLFSVIATIILQEMAARIGIVTGKGLGESIANAIANRWLRYFSIALVIVAIGIGNAAYQAGNLTGAAVGISELTNLSQNGAELLIGDVALILLLFGGHRFVQNVLIALVLAMSCVFVVTAMIVPPDWNELFTQAFQISIPTESLLTVIALIGTTVVPYNLFLHSTSAAQNWQGVEQSRALAQARIDSAVSISLGGLVTIAILSTAVVAFYGTGIQLSSVGQIAEQLTPTLGSWAHFWFACGLAAAGITSAITAPLAAGYAVSGCMGWPADIGAMRCRIVVVLVLLIGRSIAILLDNSPSEIIMLAQAANGILLPLIAIFLLFVVNRKRLLGEHRNGWPGNVLGGIVIAITIVLSTWKLITLG